MSAALFLWYQTGPPSGGAAGFVANFLPFILIFVIFYFLLILPTRQRQKQQQNMLANLKNGDRVVTTGGLRGTIVGLKDDWIHLRVPPSDVKLEVSRSAVASVIVEEEKKSA